VYRARSEVRATVVRGGARGGRRRIGAASYIRPRRRSTQVPRETAPTESRQLCPCPGRRGGSTPCGRSIRGGPPPVFLAGAPATEGRGHLSPRGATLPRACWRSGRLEAGARSLTPARGLCHRPAGRRKGDRPVSGCLSGLASDAIRCASFSPELHGRILQPDLPQALTIRALFVLRPIYDCRRGGARPPPLRACRADPWAAILARLLVRDDRLCLLPIRPAGLAPRRSGPAVAR